MDPKVYRVGILFLILIVIVFLNRKRKADVNTKKDEVRTFNKNQTVFLCDTAEDLGENMIQLYGEPFGASVRPGMKITGLDGREHVINEVYGVIKNPSKSDEEIPSGMKNTAIVVETDLWDWTLFREQRKKERIVALKLH